MSYDPRKSFDDNYPRFNKLFIGVIILAAVATAIIALV